MIENHCKLQHVWSKLMRISESKTHIEVWTKIKTEKNTGQRQFKNSYWKETKRYSKNKKKHSQTKTKVSFTKFFGSH